MGTVARKWKQTDGGRWECKETGAVIARTRRGYKLLRPGRHPPVLFRDIISAAIAGEQRETAREVA
jgi:hypothetical protein